MSNEKFPKPPLYCLGDSVFTVPQYMPHNSPQSRKFRKMFDHQQFISISKYMQDPEHRSSTFVQVPDRELETPLFHYQAVLYLTPFALAIYCGNLLVAKYLAELKDENDENVIDVNAVCYATNVSQRKGKYGDILILYPFCIAIRRELWSIIPHLVQYGWKPHEQIKLPSRTVYTCINITYTDYLDYTLGQLASKPGLAIDQLLFSLYKIHHPNFDIRKFEYVPREKIIPNFSSIAKRMLRYSKYIDKSLRNLSQILNAVRVLCNVKFFRGPVHSIFGVNLFQRLHKLEGKENWSMAEVQVFDQDSCIALLLGLIQICIEKWLPNLERKSLMILLQILLHTHWIYFFFIFEGPVLLHYFKHLEDIDCNIDVFKSIRDTAVNYTEVDSFHAQDLLYDFGANNVPELIADMIEKSKHLDDRELDFMDEKLTLEEMLRDAECLCNEMEKQSKSATSENRDIKGFTPTHIRHEDQMSSRTSERSRDFLEEFDENTPNVQSQSESVRESDNHSSVILLTTPPLVEALEKNVFVNNEVIEMKKHEDQEAEMQKEEEHEEQKINDDQREMEENNSKEDVKVEVEMKEEEREKETVKEEEKEIEREEDEEKEDVKREKVEEMAEMPEMAEAKEGEKEVESKTIEPTQLRRKSGKVSDEEKSEERKKSFHEGIKLKEEETKGMRKSHGNLDIVVSDAESVASVGTISNHSPPSSPSAPTEKLVEKKKKIGLFSCCITADYME